MQAVRAARIFFVPDWARSMFTSGCWDAAQLVVGKQVQETSWYYACSFHPVPTLVQRQAP